MRSLRLTALLSFVFLLPALAHAWAPNGTAIAHFPAPERSPAVAADGEGGIYVVWAEGVRDSARLKWTRRTAGGDPPVGWTSGGSLLSEGPAGAPLVDSDGAGGIYVAWADSLSGRIHVMRRTPNGGIPAGWSSDGIVLGSDDDVFPRVESLDRDAQGGVVVSWRFWIRTCHPAPPGPDLCHNHGGFVAVARLTPEGQLTWARDRTQVEGQDYALSIPDGAGGAVFAWYDGFVGKLNVLRFTMFGANSSGWPLQGATVATHPGIGIGSRVQILPDGAGGARMVWTGTRDGADALFFQHVRGDGTFEFTPEKACTVLTSPYLQGLSDDLAGGVFAVWWELRDGPPKLYAQHWLANGAIAPGWDPRGNRVALGTGYQQDADVQSDGEGGVFVVFGDLRAGDANLYAQRLTSAGAPAAGWAAGGNPISIESGDQRLPAIALGTDGSALVAWEDDRSPSSAPDIYAAAIAADGGAPFRLPLVDFEVASDHLTLVWQAPSVGFSAVVMRQLPGDGWRQVASLVAGASQELVFTDSDAQPGARVLYQLVADTVSNEPLSDVIRVEFPGTPVLALGLEGPNPIAGAREIVARFRLGGSTPATLELIDLNGRTVRRRVLEPAEALYRSQSLGRASEFPPGIYWLRIVQGGQTARVKVALVR